MLLCLNAYAVAWNAVECANKLYYFILGLVICLWANHRHTRNLGHCFLNKNGGFAVAVGGKHHCFVGFFIIALLIYVLVGGLNIAVPLFQSIHL